MKECKAKQIIASILSSPGICSTYSGIENEIISIFASSLC